MYGQQIQSGVLLNESEKPQHAPFVNSNAPKVTAAAGTARIRVGAMPLKRPALYEVSEFGSFRYSQKVTHMPPCCTMALSSVAIYPSPGAGGSARSCTRLFTMSNGYDANQ